MDDCAKSLGTFRGSDPSLDPYSLYLGNDILTIAFDYSTNFSKAFDKFRRALTVIFAFLFKFSYLHPSELHAQVLDKLIRVLTVFE